MKDEEKIQVMNFSNKKTDILISTTVIEVGIDIPNASVMLIEGADKFGLAQLHQLRGKVKLWLSPASRLLLFKYLSDLCKTYKTAPSDGINQLDGFKLAEMDLELRGPGAIYGSRQHGKLDLSVANITDIKLIKKAREAANKFIKEKEELSSYGT